MTKYISKAYLSDKGKIVKPGEELELTKEQAYRLGDKVESVQGEEEAPVTLHDFTVDELHELAEDNGLEGYSKLKKGDLIALIEGTEQEQE